MQSYRVNLLGVPSAYLGGGNGDARLRSKETWAVLASLLLPESLNGYQFSSYTPPCSRETLAIRFWGDSKNSPRACLRQSLASLRAAFGTDCFVTTGERHDVQAMPGCFITDIERMLTAYKASLLAPTLEERIQYLTEAEGEIHGELLEGCMEPGDSGESWLLNRRAAVHTKIVQVLVALLDALTEQGNTNAALDVARRALQFQPGDTKLRKIAWKLAVETGQEDALRTIEGVEGLGDSIARLRHRAANKLTPREGRLFDSLFLVQLSQLPPNLRESVLRLAAMPAPFTAHLARSVCRVSSSALKALQETPLVERVEIDASGSSDARYLLPEVVRTAARRQLTAATRKLLERRLAAYCHEWVMGVKETCPATPPPPFDTPERAEPFLRAALAWHFAQQAPTEKLVDLMEFLSFLGLSGLAPESIPHLRTICDNEALSLPLRYSLAVVASNILHHSGDFTAAIPWLEETLKLMPNVPEVQNVDKENRFLLAMAYHYSGNSQAALVTLQEVHDLYERDRQPAFVASCWRVRSEILNRLGEYEDALWAADQALEIRRHVHVDGSPSSTSRQVADALFWKGSALFRLARLPEAVRCVHEALGIWQQTGDVTGIGHCLRLLGRLRAEEGNFVEAAAHLSHAILLHEGTGSAGCRLAAVEALADVYFREGEPSRARPLYEECLSYHTAQEPLRPDNIAKFTERIALCNAAVA